MNPTKTPGVHLLREILEGEPLTYREVEVLHGAALGESARETGKRVLLGTETVKGYRKRACAKLGAVNLTRAVVLALALGIVKIDEVAG